MKNIIGILIIGILFSTSLFSQEFRMGNPSVERLKVEQNFGVDNHLHLREANTQYQLMDFERTLLALETAVVQNPQSADALIRRAIFRKRLGMKMEAAKDVQLASRLNPYAADLYGYNGPYSILNVIAYQPNQSVLGLKEEQKLGHYYVLLDQEYGKEQVDLEALELIESAIAQIETDELFEAMTNLNELLSRLPNSAIAYDLKGVILTKQKKYEEAKIALAKAVALQPDFAIAWYNLSRIEHEVGQYDKAKEYLDRAINLQEDLTKAYFERALLLKKMGDQEKALKDYDKIINYQGDAYLEALLNRGLTRKMLGDFNGAISDLNQAINAYPNNAELYKNRGNLYLLFGYHNRAIEDYTDAIQLQPDYAEAYYNRGLTQLIVYDVISGCQDLSKSADLGFESALEKQKFFCIE